MQQCRAEYGKGCSSLTYRKIAFGPGQRHASKGGHVVRVGQGEHPKLLRQSEWVIY